MPEKQNENSKHYRSFWPLVIIFTISALVGGVIIGVAYSNMLKDEISSFEFKIHKTQKNSTSSPGMNLPLK